MTIVPMDDFWSRLVLQVAHTEPSVRHALFALSGFHEHFLLGKASDGLQSRYARVQYDLAIKNLLSASQGPDILCAQLICCLAFISIEVRQTPND